MKIIVLLFAGILLAPPENKPAIPDYFGSGTGSGSSVTETCNLNDEDVSGPFKTCRYDCGKTLTIGERSICPFVLQH